MPVCVEPNATAWVNEEPDRTPVRIAVGVGRFASEDAVVTFASPFSADGTVAKIFAPALAKAAGLKNVYCSRSNHTGRSSCPGTS